MATGTLVPSDFGPLLSSKTPEDLHLEYKHGLELAKPEPGRTVREYVSAFANSAGGVLIIGVDEKTWSATGAAAPGGGSLSHWASRALTPIAAQLSPPARIFEVVFDTRPVLVIAVARSPVLIPTVVEGELAYFLRHHDQTFRAPAYLVSDLILGRREDHLMLPSVRGASIRVERSDVNSPDEYSFQLTLGAQNLGLRWIENCRAALVCFTNRPARPNVSDELRAHVDIDETGATDLIPQVQVGFAGAGNIPGMLGIAPFGEVIFSGLSVRLPATRSIDLRAALALLPKDSAPLWYQLRYQFHAGHRDLELAEQQLVIEIERVAAGARPRIAIGAPQGSWRVARITSLKQIVLVSVLPTREEAERMRERLSHLTGPRTYQVFPGEWP